MTEMFLHGVFGGILGIMVVDLILTAVSHYRKPTIKAVPVKLEPSCELTRMLLQLIADKDYWHWGNVNLGPENIRVPVTGWLEGKYHYWIGSSGGIYQYNVANKNQEIGIPDCDKQLLYEAAQELYARLHKKCEMWLQGIVQKDLKQLLEHQQTPPAIPQEDHVNPQVANTTSFTVFFDLPSPFGCSADIARAVTGRHEAGSSYAADGIVSLTFGFPTDSEAHAALIRLQEQGFRVER